MNADYTDIAERVNKEFAPQYRVILRDTGIFPLNKLFAPPTAGRMPMTVTMTYIYPDIDWYTGISEQKKVQPRCPYANVHRCYRYYASLYLLGEANITTKMNEPKIKELESFWAKSELLPALAEHDTGISGPDGRTTGFSNFCPEVNYDIFGLFAVSLYRYTDEIDIEAAHRQLGKKAYPNDWRWSCGN